MPAPSHTRADLNGQWTLVRLNGEKPPASPVLTLIIAANGQVGGRSAVNGFGCSLTAGDIEHGQFALSPIASTKMAGPPELMQLEDRYFRALEQARIWRIDGATLILGDGKTELARYERSAG